MTCTFFFFCLPPILHDRAMTLFTSLARQMDLPYSWQSSNKKVLPYTGAGIHQQRVVSRPQGFRTSKKPKPYDHLPHLDSWNISRPTSIKQSFPPPISIGNLVYFLLYAEHAAKLSYPGLDYYSTYLLAQITFFIMVKPMTCAWVTNSVVSKRFALPADPSPLLS